jgi:subtilisin family serine protease
MALLAWFSQAAGAADSPPLRVMLQGDSTQRLAELVRKVGGEVTHELHIINAVGAELSRPQLDRAHRSGLVSRTIDDLAVTDPPPPREDETRCELGGGLELQYEHKGLRWTLFNKAGEHLILESLELSWPEALGTVTQVTLDGQKVPIDENRQEGTSLDIQLAGQRPVIAPGTSELSVGFSRTIEPQQLPAQRDFTIKANAGEDCSAELIPGYQDNHNDFYYSTVAGAEALHYHGVTGQGVTVAVLDSGLWEHPDLATDTRGKNRVIGRFDAIRNTEGKEVFDESGHGTHMTSVLAHSGPVIRDGKATGSFKGIAPDAQLVAVKAFDHEGHGDFLDIIRGVQWVVDNREKYGIRVLNLSFAARPRWDYWRDPINQAVMRAWASGITVVAAAGNEGPEAMTIGSPGNLPYVITVGAVTDSWTVGDRTDDYIPDFSSRGPTPNAHIKPDIVAPGGHITGLTRPGSSLTEEYPEYLLSSGEFVMTGSSQASALVAGIAALLLQLEPDLTPDDIKCKLITSAEPAINADGLLAYSPFQQGHGYASATRAVTLGQRGCGNKDLDIDRELNKGEPYQGPAIFDAKGNTTLPGLEDMLSPVEAAKGHSDTRRWGVKSHIERQGLGEQGPNSSDTKPPFDWELMYESEKAAIEDLSRQPR